ncbi:hypothetical protein DFO70_12915 [Cytobacillus firmus]|uniref:Uncharacterized protein n=2 Tax=Cytobacillus TaxID=2675230 RepID=A0A366JIA0_CYTFI|nr:hypothetical protein DFO70_12915 [Cytobacillus firmus]TDX35887.1 hypothetical protein DFO72_12515 [Cytobacillus oceanisediminis]
MRIKNFLIHRKEQWDLNNLKPVICIHKVYDGGKGIKRIFCLGFKNWKPIFDFSNPFKYRF